MTQWPMPLPAHTFRPISMPRKTQPVRTNYGTFSARYAANYLRDAILADAGLRQVLAPYYVAASCAYMEGTLNNCFVEYLHRKLGRNYSQHLKPFLFMKVQDRMELAPLLLSGFKYKLNDKHDLVKDALRVFDMRNHLLHVKDLWHYADVEYGEKGEVLGWEYLVKNHPDPYRNESVLGVVEKVDIPEVEATVKRFTHRFRTMPNAINRKNFKPDAWLIKAKAT